MTPIRYFETVWERSDHLKNIHAYLSGQVTAVLNTDELLRAEWVARVSALDLYVHELVAQRMLEIFKGNLPPPAGFRKTAFSAEFLLKIKKAGSSSEQEAAFDLEVRDKLSILTFQDPEKIADAIRNVSSVELWNSIALNLGASEARKTEEAKSLKRMLSIIVERRNKIAHEGDLQPFFPRDPWPITTNDVSEVCEFIYKIVKSIDAVA